MAGFGSTTFSQKMLAASARSQTQFVTQRNAYQYTGPARRGTAMPVSPMPAGACSAEPDITHQTRDDMSCRPEVMLYDAFCSKKVLLCYMFRETEFNEYRSILRQLIEVKPTAATPAVAKMRWCMNVMVAVSRALHATNVPAPFQNSWRVEHTTGSFNMETGEGMPNEVAVPSFPFVREFWNGLIAATERAIRREITEAVASPIAPTLGGDIPGTQSSFAPYVPNAGGGGPFSAWYAVQRPINTRYNAPEQHYRVVSDDAARALGGDAARSRTRTGPEQVLQAHFEAYPGYGFAPMHQRIAVDTSFCIGSADSSSCYDYAWIPGFVMKADTTVDYCAAWAREIIDTPFPVFSSRGIIRWFAQLLPYIRSGRLRVSEAEMSQHMQNLSEAAADEGNMAGGALAGEFIGEALGSIYGVIASAVTYVFLWVITEIGGVAASWPCPQLPFKRTFSEGECSIRSLTSENWSETELPPEIDQALITMETRSGLPLRSSLDEILAVPDDSEPPTPPPGTPPLPPYIAPVWTKYAIVGSVAVVGALLLRRLR